MNVEIGAEAAQFPEKEYINGITFAVRYNDGISPLSLCLNAANAPSNKGIRKRRPKGPGFAKKFNASRTNPK